MEGRRATDERKGLGQGMLWRGVGQRMRGRDQDREMLWRVLLGRGLGQREEIRREGGGAWGEGGGARSGWGEGGLG